MNSVYMRHVNAEHLAGKLAKVAHAEGLNIHNMSHSSTARGHESKQTQKRPPNLRLSGICRCRNVSIRNFHLANRNVDFYKVALKFKRAVCYLKTLILGIKN